MYLFILITLLLGGCIIYIELTFLSLICWSYFGQLTASYIFSDS